MELVLWIIALLLFIGLIVFTWAAENIVDCLTRIAEALEGKTEAPPSTPELERQFRESLDKGDQQ